MIQGILEYIKSDLPKEKHLEFQLCEQKTEDYIPIKDGAH